MHKHIFNLQIIHLLWTKAVKNLFASYHIMRLLFDVANSAKAMAAVSHTVQCCWGQGGDKLSAVLDSTGIQKKDKLANDSFASLWYCDVFKHYFEEESRNWYVYSV